MTVQMKLEDALMSTAQASRVAALRGLGRIPTDSEKNWVSVLADARNASGVVEVMRDLEPWSDSSWRPISMGGWYSSADALNLASSGADLSTFQQFGAAAAGGAASTTTGVNITFPGDPGGLIGSWGRSAGGATADASLKAKKFYDDLFDLPWWVYVVGAAVVSVPVFYYGGGFIKAAGNLAHRATR